MGMPIKDICLRICSGGTPTSTYAPYYDGDIPWLNTKEIDFNYINSTERTISLAGLENSSAKWIEAPAVIVAMYGATAGKSAISNIRLTTNQACCNLNINPKIADYRFVYYSLKNDYIRLASLANGGAQQNLSAQQIKDFEVPCYDLKRQHRIADILSSLDDKIETNRAINARLEELAAAIFKSWFIDFEPFANEEFIEDEYGRRPKGWKIGKITDISSVIMGQSPDGDSLNTVSGTIFYQGSTEFGSRFPSIKKFTTTPTRFAEPFSVLLSVRAPVGALNVAYQKCCIGRGLASIKSKYKSYIFYSLKSYQSTLNRYNGEGTVFGCIKRSDVENIPVIIPPIEILTKFENLIQPIDNKIYNNFCQNRELSSLRDTLLPSLMSGELIPE